MTSDVYVPVTASVEIYYMDGQGGNASYMRCTIDSLAPWRVDTPDDIPSRRKSETSSVREHVIWDPAADPPCILWWPYLRNVLEAKVRSWVLRYYWSRRWQQ